MKITHLVTSAAVIATLAFAAPAFAQHRGGGGRSAGSARAAAPRGVAPRGVAPRSVGPRAGVSAQRVGPAVRGYAGGVRGVTRLAPGYRVAPRVVVGGGAGFYSPVRFYNPYYSFRPRFSLGFGLFAGYPVAYPYYAYPYAFNPYYAYGYSPYGYYGYDDDYAPPYAGAPAPGYPASAPYGMPAPGTVQAQQAPQAPMANASNTGGVSFEITPATAEVFIDGNDFGQVSSFSPNTAPLSLTPGRHHVEIRAQGYQTLSFDSDVVAGQVIPYQGQMQPAR